MMSCTVAGSIAKSLDHLTGQQLQTLEDLTGKYSGIRSHGYVSEVHR